MFGLPVNTFKYFAQFLAFVLVPSKLNLYLASIGRGLIANLSLISNADLATKTVVTKRTATLVAPSTKPNREDLPLLDRFTRMAKRRRTAANVNARFTLVCRNTQ